MVCTSRTDSDIPSLYENRVPIFDGSSDLRDVLMGKTKTIAWFVSNCNASSKREDFVEELREHIDVDIYGQCGPLNCSDGQRDVCLNMLSTDYKFYLSLENSFCRDYVTEKLWNALAGNAIPVVYGAVDYSQFAPAESFIDFRDFASAQHLAEHLKYLDGNQTAYEEYFEWRKHYAPKPPCSAAQRTGDECRLTNWCRLCQMLNDPSLPRKNYQDIECWYTGGGECGQRGPIRTANSLEANTWVRIDAT